MSSLSYASKWVGYTEPEANRTVFAEMVQNDSGMDFQGKPWCVIFIYAVHPDAIKLGRPCSGIYTLLRKVVLRLRWRGRGYAPKCGDLVFLRNSMDEIAGHVEIVEDYDGDLLTSIGGNTLGGRVARKFRDIQDWRIIGFAVM